MIPNMNGFVNRLLKNWTICYVLFKVPSYIVSEFCLQNHETALVSLLANENYCKNPKISDTRKFAVITLKVEQDGLSIE